MDKTFSTRDSKQASTPADVWEGHDDSAEHAADLTEDYPGQRITGPEEPPVPIGVAVVFSGPHGFVTDLGAAQAVTTDPPSTPWTLPRYGVWKPAGRRPQVVHTTNNLEEAIALASGGAVNVEA